MTDYLFYWKFKYIFILDINLDIDKFKKLWKNNILIGEHWSIIFNKDEINIILENKNWLPGYKPLFEMFRDLVQTIGDHILSLLQEEENVEFTLNIKHKFCSFGTRDMVKNNLLDKENKEWYIKQLIDTNFIDKDDIVIENTSWITLKLPILFSNFDEMFESKRYYYTIMEHKKWNIDWDKIKKVGFSFKNNFYVDQTIL